jgi:hypothetical protein
MSASPSMTSRPSLMILKRRIIKEGREVIEGEALMAKVESMSSGTCTCEVRTENVRNQDAWPRGVEGMSGEGFLVW